MSSPAYPAGYGPTQQGYGPPAIAQQNVPTGLPQISIHTVLVALRCWWHIALPMGLLLAAGAATVVYYITKPTYTASVWIEIAPPMKLIPGSVGEDSQRYVANQTELMRSPPVLEPVIALPAVRSAPELRDQEDPVRYLRDKLQIRPLGSSDFFVIAFRSEDAAKAALIVDEVAKSYLNLYQKHDSRVAGMTIEILTEQAKEQFGEVQLFRDKVDDLTKQLTGDDAVLPPIDENDKQLAESMHQQLEKQLLNAKVELFATTAELTAEEKFFQQEEFTPPDEFVAPRVAADPQLAQRKAELTIKKEKRDEHKKVSKNLAANTVYQQLEREIAADEVEIAKLTQERHVEIKSDLEKAGRMKRQAQIAEAEGGSGSSSRK